MAFNDSLEFFKSRGGCLVGKGFVVEDMARLSEGGERLLREIFEGDMGLAVLVVLDDTGKHDEEDEAREFGIIGDVAECSACPNLCWDMLAIASGRGRVGTVWRSTHFHVPKSFSLSNLIFSV